MAVTGAKRNKSHRGDGSAAQREKSEPVHKKEKERRGAGEQTRRAVCQISPGRRTGGEERHALQQPGSVKAKGKSLNQKPKKQAEDAASKRRRQGTGRPENGLSWGIYPGRPRNVNTPGRPGDDRRAPSPKQEREKEVSDGGGNRRERLETGDREQQDGKTERAGQWPVGARTRKAGTKEQRGPGWQSRGRREKKLREAKR